MSKFTDLQLEVFDSIVCAYEEDPSPESGRTYMRDDEEYTAAQELLESGLLREVTWGVHSNVRWAHFGLTDAGFEAAEGL